MTLFCYRPHCFSHVNHVVVMITSPHLHKKDSEVCVKSRSPRASLLLKGQVTDHTTVKWAIEQIKPFQGKITVLYIKSYTVYFP